MRETLKDMMAGVATAPGSKAKLVAHNTVRYQRPDGATAWRLHHTDVVIRLPDGTFELNSGGWKTITTKDRINNYAPVQVYTDKGIWYLSTGVPFYDGMRVRADGEPIGFSAATKQIVDKQLRLKARIKKFVDKLDSMEKIPEPNSGDCWYCSMFYSVKPNAGGRANGFLHEHDMPSRNGDTEHLDSHMREGYLHGSLILNAMRAKGFTDTGIGYYYDSANRGDTWGRQVIKRSLRSYLGQQFGLATR